MGPLGLQPVVHAQEVADAGAVDRLGPAEVDHERRRRAVEQGLDVGAEGLAAASAQLPGGGEEDPVLEPRQRTLVDTKRLHGPLPTGGV